MGPLPAKGTGVLGTSIFHRNLLFNSVICVTAARHAAFPLQHTRVFPFSPLLTFSLPQGGGKADSTRFSPAARKQQGPVLENALPLSITAVGARVFPEKRLPLLLAGKGNHSLKLMSEMEKPFPKPGMIS